MPKFVDADSRKTNVSISLSHAVRSAVLAEAEARQMNFSAAMEALAIDGLKAAGYPSELFEGPKVRKATEDAELMAEFLENYANVSDINQASRSAGISNTTVYLWARNNPQFAAKFAELRSSKRRPGTSNHHSDSDFAIIQRARSQQPGNGRRPIRELPRRGEESAATEM